MDSFAQVLCKDHNRGVQLQLPSTFWDGGSKEQRTKLYSCTVTWWDRLYNCKRKYTCPGAFLG